MERREFFGVLGGAVVSAMCAALVAVVIVFMVPNAKAQEAEPRSYSNTPVGLNFLIAGYLYTQGKSHSIRNCRSPTQNFTLIPGPWLTFGLSMYLASPPNST